MEGNKAGVGVVVIIAILVAVSFAYVLSTPTTSGSSIKIPNNPAHTNTTLLWADAQGWNLNHGTVNPTLNYSVGTVVTFQVTEEDSQPHNLYVVSAPSNPTNGPISYENAGQGYKILSTSDITQTPGHTTTGKYYFSKAGIYVYWCDIHKQTMVGWVYVNATSSSSVVSSPAASGQGTPSALSLNAGAILQSGFSQAYVNQPSGFISGITHLHLSNSFPSNINPVQQYTAYLGIRTDSGTIGGSGEL